ncbi:MAG: NAD(P)/FAD-dependent oxidoreductase [Burkholderiales bacterium]|nr:NAD(P)/FAD-dependent oxidoreductase [Burkholderiales bacterium]
MQAQALNRADAIETDAVIVGAGPVGLFQVFELGLLEIKAHIIDSLAYPGGQCIELYPDKPIYDIPAVPMCTGKELTDSLLKQIEPFGATFHLGQEVTTVEKQDDGRFYVATSKGAQFLAKALFIAGGVGSFQPRLLKVEGIEPYEGEQVHYRVKDPARFAGKHLVIVGGGDSAVDWALNFCAGNADGNPHKAEGIDERDGRLAGLKITGNDGVTRVVPCDEVLVFFGLSPKLGPIADWGLALERKQIVVDTEKFETSVPGIFAVGDVNTYPGKKKLILSGFHECALAAFGAAPYVFPDKRIHLQYTTTSPKLHKVLGVESPVFD